MSQHTMNIYKAVKSVLVTANVPGGTLNYVQAIYEGWRNRDDIPAFPVIILEPVDEPETRYSVPYNIRGVFEIVIIPFMEELDPDKQIIGDGVNKGIMDMVTDIKNLLSIDKSLGGTALKFEFPRTPYHFDYFPNRFAEISMQIEYVTQDTVR